MLLGRQIALSRTRALFLQREDLEFEFETEAEQPSQHSGKRSCAGLKLYLRQAGLSIPVWTIWFTAGMFAVALTCCASLILSVYLLPIIAAAAFVLPFLWLEHRVSNRAAEFSADYPSVLLATASSLKTGVTLFLALERAIRLLPSESIVRRHIEDLLDKLRRGVAKEQAIAEFGSDIRQPDLQLFRSAFVIAAENGGRFAPTLERLATVCRDRSSLISGARVSTANMRMTANILMVITPIVILMVSLRTPNYWDILVEHPTANLLASIGIVIIVGCYGLLQKLSRFKP